MKNDDEPKISFRRRLKPRAKICPKCLSPLKTASSLGGWLIPHYYQCDTCGYYGAFALEPEE